MYTVPAVWAGSLHSRRALDLLKFMGFVLRADKNQDDSLPGGELALRIDYPQSIEARLGELECKRCDRRVRASFRAGPSDWPGHRKAK